MAKWYEVNKFEDIFKSDEKIQFGDILLVYDLVLKNHNVYTNVTGYNTAQNDWMPVSDLPPMRYFMITAQNDKHAGYYTRKAIKFPSQTQIEDDLHQLYGYHKGKIVILNIFEFKSEQDYNDFLGN